MKFCSQEFKNNFISKKLADEQGSILIIALMIMAVLALLGTIASNTSITEMQVAANEKYYNQTFYAADGAWQEAAAIINRLGDDAPEPDSVTKVLDLSAMDTTANIINGIPYTYVITELNSNPASGSGEGYLQFQYQIDTTTYDPADNTKERQKVRVVVNKLFKSGYGE